MTWTGPGNPLGAVLGRLIVGLGDDLEYDGGEAALRVYIDARYLNRYVLVHGEEAIATARRAWANSFMGHAYLYPPPPADAIYQDQTEYEKREGS